MHPILAEELAYKEKYRSHASPEDAFFLGPEGTQMDTERLLDQFHRAVYLAFVTMEARLSQVQLDDSDAEHVAFYLLKRRVRTVGGSRLRASTLGERMEVADRIVALMPSRRGYAANTQTLSASAKKVQRLATLIVWVPNFTAGCARMRNESAFLNPRIMSVSWNAISISTLSSTNRFNSRR